MRICSQCRQRIDTDQPDHTRRFPAFTVLGGLIGAVGAACAGPGALLLVPAAAIVGLAADVGRCDLCGDEVDQDNPGYQVMEEFDKGIEGRSYRPVGCSQQPGRPQRGAGPPAARQNLGPWGSTAPAKPSSRLDDDLRDDGPREPRTFVCDELQGRLVPEDPEMGEPGPDPDGSAGLTCQTDQGLLPSLPSLFDEPFGQDLLDLGQPGLDLGTDLEIPEGPPLGEPLP